MASYDLQKTTPKQFAGSAATNGNIGQFGSLAAGNPNYTNDPATIQGLDQFMQGWRAALSGNSSAPRLEDFNGLHYLFSYFLCYLYQKGVAAWSADEKYYPGCVCVYDKNLWMYVGNTSSQGVIPSAVQDWRNLSAKYTRRVWLDKSYDISINPGDNVLNLTEIAGIPYQASAVVCSPRFNRHGAQSYFAYPPDGPINNNIGLFQDAGGDIPFDGYMGQYTIPVFNENNQCKVRVGGYGNVYNFALYGYDITE